MSNRLESEFPPVRWRAVPPGVDHDLIELYMQRGRKLRSEAFGRIAHAAYAAVAGALTRVATFVRCALRSRAGQASVGDCWANPARGA